VLRASSPRVLERREQGALRGGGGRRVAEREGGADRERRAPVGQPRRDHTDFVLAAARQGPQRRLRRLQPSGSHRVLEDVARALEVQVPGEPGDRARRAAVGHLE
jgi:hypothetical protein